MKRHLILTRAIEDESGIWVHYKDAQQAAVAAQVAVLKEVLAPAHTVWLNNHAKGIRRPIVEYLLAKAEGELDK